ncbi:MarR family winged helix-turn-helix transcriptional regulator [uncultured Sneathiella sp.]|jgi:DNA-binding MarR family transcriptional regulator|uniref:MarR family winged helix-turn-helix transcriptional regulator n=1 Tax=uncultured Sneathiella sp. TaxID=879315 RepID=UPI0030DA3620|tara:strand:+ start:55157 stop:55600 length:444 start_codon:yes stop_codon:yes gene_type:complete
MNDNSITDATPACICLRFRKAARRVSQIYDQHLEPYGLTITQYGLLGHIHRFEGIGVGALADKLVMDPTTLTRNLRPLERKGFVLMTPDEDDRRSRNLNLTTSGRRILDAARPGWRAAQEKIRTVLGPDNNKLMIDTIDQMIDDLRE